MNLNPESQKPLYLQISEQIEDSIFTSCIKEETQIPSTNEVALRYKINPATVLKGMNILVDDKVIYKKRGIGMFVCEGAYEKIKTKRQNKFYDSYIGSLVTEAKKLGLDKKEIFNMIDRRYSNGSNSIG